MATKFFGILIFISVFSHSFQYQCYRCNSGTTSSLSLQATASGTPKTKITTTCTDPLTDNLLANCPGDCVLFVTSKDNQKATSRGCREDTDCVNVNNTLSQWGITIETCSYCSKDKCNSATEAVVSVTLLSVSVFFVAFRILFQ